jgi:ribosomal protein L34
MPDDQTIVEGDAGFLGMASRLNPLQLQPGMVQYCENMRLDRGVAQTRKGAKRVANEISLPGEFVIVRETGTTMTLGIDRSVTITRSGTLATATIASGHGYTANDLINIRGATPDNYNGDWFITNVTPTSFQFTLPADPGANATGTIFANKGPVIKQVYEGGIFASGIYSSPRLDNANEYVVLAGPNAAYLWKQNGSIISKSYPNTDTILSTDDVSILQAFDKLYILRDRPESKLRVTSITQTGGTLNTLRDTWLFSTTSIFAVGDEGTILNYNGKIWTAQVTDTNENLNSIWAANSTNAWAVGNAGTILRYDGTSWSTQTSGTTENLLAVWGTTSSHLVAVGANGTILLYNGTSWSPQTSGTTQDLRGVWGTAANNVYAVGNNGTILRWTGSSWSALTSSISDALNSVWGTSTTNIYAVGASGRILRSTNGTAWSALTSGVTDTLNSVWGSGTTNIFAAGNGGRLLRSTDGATWASITSNTTSDLFEVGGSSSTNMAAVGSAGTIILSTNSTSWTAVVRGIATAITSAAHGYSVNQAVRITGVTDPANLPEGVTTSEAYNGEFIIRSVPTSTTFTYAVPGTTFATAAGNMFAQRIQPSLVWDGDPATNFVRVNIGTLAEFGQLSFIGMPSTAIATYFNNQVVVARGRDEILVSDVLDGETYDAILKTFRANAGSNDYIVAIHPFAEQQLLIFCRNSIYLARVIFDTSGFLDLSNSSLTLLTNEVGCAARRSVVTAGTAVFFLSDRGVFRLDSQLDLKLRGNTKPLSDEISDQIAKINTNAIQKSCAAYYDNRLYIAVPLMGDDKKITSLTRPDPATNTARATITRHGYKAGQFITISGAVQDAYNGTWPISNVTTNTFDFTVQNLPATPATGTIIANKGATAPQTIFIYNMLNQQWESKDTYNFAIDGFTIATFGSERRLFANSVNGRLYLLDESADGYDDTQTADDQFEFVEGTLLTRRYSWGTDAPKRIHRLQANLVTTTDHDDITLDAVTIDPDTDLATLSLTETAFTEAEDYTLKASVRRRAHAFEARYRTQRGRPILRTITAHAQIAPGMQTHTVK